MSQSEFIRLTTRDSVELHGALHHADGEPKLTADAVVFLHGAGGNFYASSLLAGVLPALRNAGAAVLAINTRGHDSVCTLKTAHGGRRGGAAFEVVDECCRDVRGAVDFLVERGLQRIALFGHSLGAIKAVYSQAYDPHHNVSHVVALSPPRLSYAAYCRGPRREEFLSLIAAAEQHVQSGAGDQLMDVTIPLPLLITASGYLDKYGPGERYNIAEFLPRVAQPALYVFGEKELAADVAAFSGIDAEVRGLAANMLHPPEVVVIPQADHFYAGRHAALAETLTNWPAWRASPSP